MTVDDIDNTGRKASFLDKLAHDQHGQGRLLSQLQNNGVTAAQGRTQFPPSHAKRIVPRDYLAAHTNGLLESVGKLAGADVDDLSKVLVCVASVVLQGIDDL